MSHEVCEYSDCCGFRKYLNNQGLLKKGDHCDCGKENIEDCVRRKEASGNLNDCEKQLIRTVFHPESTLLNEEKAITFSETETFKQRSNAREEIYL